MVPDLRQADPPAIRLGEPKNDVAPGTLELKGMAEFTPPSPIADFLDVRKASKPSTVNARFGTLAQGPITIITLSKGKYRVRSQLLPLTHSMFATIAEVAAGLTPGLIVNVEGTKLTGRVGLASGKKIEELSTLIHKTPEILGLRGFAITELPSMTNKLNSGHLQVGLKGVKFRLGGAFSGAFNVEVVDENIAFDGHADIHVGGLVNGPMEFKRTTNGLVTGKALLALKLSENLSGSIDVLWDGQAVTGMLKAEYKNNERLSGWVILRLMERGQAEQLKAAKNATAGPPRPPAAAPRTKETTGIDYVVFGEGDLDYRFNDWLHGNAHVIISPEGYLTVIGKITSDKEFPLYSPKPYYNLLLDKKAEVFYGIPYLANVFLFGEIKLEAFAFLNAILYKVEVGGEYSTDPKKSNTIYITGSLNISAEAKLQLTLKAGGGVEILAHKIQVGGGLAGYAGVRGYLEAKPTFGRREKAGDSEPKQTEFYIKGDVEMAAQAFVGLSGFLFIELVTPWWSPLSDETWPHPLFNKEWPIGSMGFNASMDYVFGSGQPPTFDLKRADFDPEKFMMSTYHGEAKSGSGTHAEQKPNWRERNSAAAQPPPKTSPKGTATPGVLAPVPAPKAQMPASGAKKSTGPADPNAKTAKGQSVKQAQEEAKKTGGKPAGKDVAKAKGAGKDQRTNAQKQADLDKAMTEAEALLEDEAMTPQMVKERLPAIKAKYKMTSLMLVTDSQTEAEETDHLEGEINPKAKKPKVKKKKGAKKAKGTAQLAAALNKVILSKPFIAKEKKAYKKKLAMTRDESRRQVKIQQEALNSLAVAAWQKNWAKFYPPEGAEEDEGGRSDEAQASSDRDLAIAVEREKVIAEWMNNNPGKTRANANAFADKLFTLAPGDKAYPFLYKSRISNGITYENPVYGKTILHAADQAVGGGSATAGLGGARENFSIGAQWGRGGRAKILKGQLDVEITIAGKTTAASAVAKLELNVELPVIDG